MAISLQKGGSVNLSKEAPGMKKMLVGLGWNLRATDGDAFDLDGSVFLLGAGGKVRSDADFVFYNQAKSSDGSVVHSGDNRTGEGEGDDEVTFNNPGAALDGVRGAENSVEVVAVVGFLFQTQ